MHKLQIVAKIAKGYSSEIFLVKIDGKDFVLKREKQKSPRIEMAKKEAANLLLANSLGIGPKLFAFDLEKREIIMEYIDSFTFNEWLFKRGPSKKQLEKFIFSLFKQAKKLDEAGLDHGQLAGKGKNILVRKKGLSPVIIDFEKASQSRKCHNVSQLQSFLYNSKHSAITKKVKEILGA